MDMEITLTYKSVELTVVGDYTRGQAGKYHGPWEDSWPDEPSEFDVEDILVEGTSIIELVQCMQIALNTSPIRHADALGEISDLAAEYCDNLEADYDEA